MAMGGRRVHRHPDNLLVGAESVIFMQGTGRDAIGLKRLASAFGSPNFMTCGPASGLACFWPRVANTILTMGEFMAVPDMAQHYPDRYDNPEWKRPECILIWGCNPAVNCEDGFFGHWVVDSMRRGTEIIVVDPRETWLASRAKTWLQGESGFGYPFKINICKVYKEEENGRL